MLQIRPFTREDIPLFVSWIESPEFLMQTAGPLLHFDSLDADMGALVDHAALPGTDTYLFSVTRKTEDGPECIGTFHILQVNRHHRSATLSRVLLAKNVRGSGYGSMMIREALRIAFEELKLHRLSLAVFDFNIPAYSCYVRAGFVREGVQRDIIRNGSEYWSTVSMSILEHEYRAKHGTSRVAI
ncbi:MAG: GNAT family N-acetyltransferase [Spirochaetota bacterium]